MAKTQYYTATSIDGYIADENNSLEWLFEVDEGTENPFGEFFEGVGAFAMGATTYEWILEHDNLIEEPENWHDMYGNVPCWVFTHRDLPLVPDANIFMISGDVRRVHEAMMVAAQGRNVWLAGGGNLVGQFVAEGLLDEIILGIVPAILGSGVPMLRHRLLVNDLVLTNIREVGQFAYLTYAVGDVARLGRHLASEVVTRIPVLH
ncbi:dihydrofolate reductase family protein [Actinoplanes hulinensis]|uniref:Dihydrofolate reductase family protein n=1 Tax=Actinoplanes hulinensis TaxID=1144547 RepID=A0ABS7B9Q1_9ACTN|nr:dihydrofolate reductase family protein [Actinoplanes hulinensis]MBW6437791.1 dihydrofolate reductase family protein [Actinoplanes hulinensis]